MAAYRQRTKNLQLSSLDLADITKRVAVLIICMQFVVDYRLSQEQGNPFFPFHFVGCNTISSRLPDSRTIHFGMAHTLGLRYINISSRTEISTLPTSNGSAPTSKGYAELKVQFDRVKAEYDGTTHSQRVCNQFITTNHTINRIVIMGIGDIEKGWWQLSMITALARNLNVTNILAQEDYSYDSSTLGSRSPMRQPEDIPKYTDLYRSLGIDYKEYAASDQNDERKVGSIAKHITHRTLLFAPFLGFVKTAATLDQAPAYPEFYIGTEIQEVAKGCAGKYEELKTFAEEFEPLYRWTVLPTLRTDKDPAWNVPRGEFHRMAFGWRR